jgi:hypothetical protein
VSSGTFKVFLSSGRNFQQIFAHRYTRADDDEHGRDVWASVQS